MRTIGPAGTFLILLGVLAAVPVQAQTPPGICDRTQQVQDGILNWLSGVSDCAEVTTTHLTTVTELTLESVGLTSLRADDFAGLTDLKELRLTGNKQLLALPSGVFSGLTKMETLNLGNNRIPALRAEAFSGLSALETLNLERNRLPALPAGVFSGLTKLKTLSLSANLLTAFPAGMFSGLAELETLDLGGNDLTQVPAEVFSDISALKTLILRWNQIGSVPDGAFSDLPNLEKLDLFSNLITALPSGAFSGLTKLKVLMAGSNQLVALPDGVFSGLTMLDILDVAENPVHPLLLTVTVEMAGSDRVRAKVPAGAPFALSLPVNVTNGGLAGGASTLEITAGAVEGEAVAVTRTEDTTGAVTVDLGTPLPSPPMGTHPPYRHRGYAFVRAPSGLPVKFVSPAWVRNVRVVSGPGADGVWSAGERVELEVRYSLPVVVEQPEDCWSYNDNGTCRDAGPYVLVAFRSDARPGYGKVLSTPLVPYVGGSGTDTLRFAYTVGAAEAGAKGVVAADGRLLLRGATIRTLEGGDGASRYTITRVMQVDVRTPSGRAWTAGEKVRVRVRFTGPPQPYTPPDEPLNWDKVDVAGGAPTIDLLLGDRERRTLARTARYVSGSGTNTLTFEYEVTAVDGRVGAVEVEADSLASNGATIRNERGYDAELGHLSAVRYAQRPVLSVADAEATEGEDATLDFVVKLDGNSGSQVTVAYRTRDETAEAGFDYTETRGRLTFAPGEYEKTVSVPIRDDAVEDDEETFTLLLSNVSGAGVANDDYEAVGTIRNDETEALSGGLTANFEGMPAEHRGEGGFHFRVAFSENIGISFRALREDAFTVTGGRVTGGKRVDGRRDLFRMTVRPDSDGAVTITLQAERECAVSGAICTKGKNRRQLTNSPSATVAGPPVEPLTASFEDLPVEHEGESAFTLRIAFSEPLSWMNGRRLREDVVAVAGGRATKAGRVNRRRDLWELTVEPDSLADVTVTLAAGAACDSPAAVCTKDGRALSNTISATVRGPVGIAVADARVEEGAGAVLAFAVTLSRAASGTLTVDYATSDGTATAGSDYTAASGTLTFTAGESSKTIGVTVLDDSHDEGEETLTLRLSNPSGGRLTDGKATGTIENRDPLPKAFMARFGRTAAVHVVEQVQERIEARRETGFEAQFAGRQLRPGMGREMAVEFLSRLAPSVGANRVGAGVHHPRSVSPVAGSGSLGTPGLGGGAPMGTADELLGGANPMGSMPGTDGGLNQRGHLGMGLGGGNLLTGSAFVMNHETRRGGVLSFWSRGAQSQFAGRDGRLSLGGRVRTTMFGADYAKGPLITGLSLSHSRGLGEYTGVDVGEVTSAVTGLYPWLGYKVSDRITLWGVTGYGKGALRLTPGAGTTLRSGLSMAMTAGGMRGELADSVVGGFGLAFKADALWVGTGIEGVDGPEGRLAATSAAVTRYRTALEASRGYSFQRGLSLQPSLEVGVRRDGGDAENGAGVDVGGGLIVSDAVTGLSADVRVRMLLAHQDRGFRDRGVSISFGYNPTPSTPLGFVAKLTPSWGGQATSGAQALWGRETMAGMAHGGRAAGNRLEAELGYGLPVGGRLVGTPRFGIGTSEHGRDYRLGYGLTVLQRGSMNFELGIEGTRRESSMQGGTDHGALARLTASW